MRKKDYLLDTNIAGYFAELKSGNATEESKNLEKHLNRIPLDAKIFVSSITIGELQYGYCVASSEKKQEVKKICDYFKNNVNLYILNVDENSARDHYSIIREKLYEKYAPKIGKKKHRIEQWKNPIAADSLGIQENDLWISAIALNYNLILVSNDKMNVIKSVIGKALDFEDWLT